jgi:hypothetical protein
VIPGEMFHVFGLRLLFSEIGAIDIPKAEVVGQCKQYVDSLRDSDQIVNKYIDKAKIDTILGWESRGFYNADTREFQDVLNYYRSVIDEVARCSLPQLGGQLLNIMKSDSQKYFRMLCPNDFEHAVYYNVPVLAAIPTSDFVEEVLRLGASSQNTVFAAFRARYETGLLARDLVEEKKWLQEFKSLFDEKAKNLRPLSRYRILGTVGHNIGPFLVSENIGSEQVRTTGPH